MNETMDDADTLLVNQIVELAQRLPLDVVRDITERIRNADSPNEHSAVINAIHSIPHPDTRNRVYRLFESWKKNKPDVNIATAGWALLAAAEADKARREAQSVELVWTGPVPSGTNLRRTDQVLLDLIRRANESIWIVTFAAYKIEEISQALLEAIHRGVSVSIVIETPKHSDDKVSVSPVDAIGVEVARKSKVYVWPLDKRPKDDNANHGALHVKCAVADDLRCFVSSANLTGNAMNLNMELGVLVRGNELASRITTHLKGLIQNNTLIETADV